MEVAIIKRESTGSGTHLYNESETLIKFEIMDGAPVRGESIPVRLFLNSCVEHLTPTYRNVHTKFSTKYYLNLVLVDEEDRRYFKQQLSAPFVVCALFVCGLLTGFPPPGRLFCGASRRERRARKRRRWPAATSVPKTWPARRPASPPWRRPRPPFVPARRLNEKTRLSRKREKGGVWGCVWPVALLGRGRAQ
jgi:hypothetical protein